MRIRISLVIFICIDLLFLSLSGSLLKAEVRDRRDCSRIVSLAPSITETIYYLGLGDNLVGVTRFCKYPENAELLPKIGGLLDPNIEAVLGLRPSVVIVLEEQSDVANRLRQLGLDTLAVEHRRVEGILHSLNKIEAACRDDTFGEVKVNELREKIKKTLEVVNITTRPRVMVVVGRTGGSESPEGVFVSGSDGYYNDLVNLAGGINVNRASTASFPVLSREGIIKVDPEVIVEIVMNPTGNIPIMRDSIIKQWEAIPYISAVKNRRISVFDSDYVSVPGPRYIELLADMVKAIHPNSDANDASS